MVAEGGSDCSSGPLDRLSLTARQQSVLLTLIGTVPKVSKVSELSPMPAADVATYGLPAGDWWSGVVEVPLTACVLNFVFSDKERKAWDNNKNTDFHSTVLGGSSF